MLPLAPRRAPRPERRARARRRSTEGRAPGPVRGSADLVGVHERGRIHLTDCFRAQPDALRLAVDPDRALLQVRLDGTLVHAHLLQADAALLLGGALALAGGGALGPLPGNGADARHDVPSDVSPAHDATRPAGSSCWMSGRRRADRFRALECSTSAQDASGGTASAAR